MSIASENVDVQRLVVLYIITVVFSFGNHVPSGTYKTGFMYNDVVFSTAHAVIKEDLVFELL